MLATQLVDFFQIILIDLAMAGDNAIAVGLAAAGLPKDKRHHAVIAGIAAATILRIVFAIFATKILHITGLMVAGGLLLLWVSWKMYREVRHLHRTKKNKGDAGQGDAHDEDNAAPKKLSSAITQIILADVSMSLDNILAVAGVARDHIWLLVAGLGLSVVLMGAAATYIAKLTHRYPWIGYIGVALIAYAALSMMWDGGHDIAAKVN